MELYQRLYQRLFIQSEAAAKLHGLQRVDLLKAIEAHTRDLFTSSEDFSNQRSVLGEPGQEQALKAILDQQWTGIEEYSAVFFKVAAQPSL